MLLLNRPTPQSRPFLCLVTANSFYNFKNLNYFMSSLQTLELYIAPGCPHCPNMIKISSELVKQGSIAKLEIINIAVANDLAAKFNIRSVPTFRIGEVVLTGAHTLAELKAWIDKSSSEAGLVDYYNQEFDQGELDKVIQQVEKKPELLKLLLSMLLDLGTPLTSRIAISAIFEHFQNNESLFSLIPVLCENLSDKNESVRIDVAHVLGLTGSLSAIPCLEKVLADDFEDVRETAREAIDSIRHINH